MICSSENRFRFIFRLLSMSRILAPSGLNRGGHIKAYEDGRRATRKDCTAVGTIVSQCATWEASSGSWRSIRLLGSPGVKEHR